MKKSIICLSTFAAMLLSGCNVYRTYKPANEVPENLYRTEVSAEDTASIANMDWKELFTDPILQSLIEEALENNTDMKTAQLKVESAKASLMSARLAFLPSINLAPQGTLSSFDGSPVSKAYNIAASASWEIDIFGKLRNASKSAAAALMQSKEYEQAVRTSLIAGMANCYYTLLLLDEQLSISENTLVLWAENVKTMKAMKEAGMTNEAGVAQIEASYLATEASVVTLKTQIEEMENTISNMLAKVPGPVKRGKLENQSFPEQLSVGVPVDLLRNRPDVRMAEYGVAQAFYGVNIARGQFYPSLTLSGTAGWTNSGSGIISNPGAWLLQAVGQVVQPIFNRGALIANLKISKNAYEEAALAFQQTVLEAGSEVNNALTQWQASRQRLDLTAKQVAALETAYKSTQLLMQHSSTTYLEVLTAQQTLLQAQLGHSAEKYNEIQAVITLYNALGGGRN